MKQNLLSIVIPSRSTLLLQKTIDDLLKNAVEEIEIVVVLDGIWPETPLRKDGRVTVLHHGSEHNNPGMRASINKGVAASKGQYIMKIDEHCMVDNGFDAKLKADCADDWLIVPREYGFDSETWTVSPMQGNRGCVDNFFLNYPHLDYLKWNAWYDNRKDILIDDCLGMRGSCYFMARKHWDWLGGLNEKMYGKFHHEPQEICLKTWLGGRRVVTNKKTWYAHWHRRARGYKFSNAQYQELIDSKDKISAFVQDYWFNDRWEDRVHNFEWLIDKFWPVQTWPVNWKEIHQLKQAELLSGKAGRPVKV